MKQDIDLSKLSEEELLSLRICDLPLTIEGTWLDECVGELYRELDIKGIKLKPPCYLADEWLAPDKEPVVGIPFFLAHPVLIKLERKMMLDVEGGTRLWCMRLLRHETGHAINYAYRLYRRRKWQKVFGQFSEEYKDTYRFRPYSKSFVRHLEDYYAQYHPDEDFAETFAVWLTPNLDWRKQYKGWKAAAKLNYVNELMEEIKEKEPLMKQGKKYWQVSRVRKTLKNFYKKKKHFYAEDLPDFHDSNLKKIFISSEKSVLGIKNKKNSNDNSKILSTRLVDSNKNESLPQASGVIKKYKRNILNNVAKWTGEKKFIIDGLLDTIIQRCRALGLIADKPEPLVILEVSAYVTVLVMNYLYTGRFGKGK